MLHITPAAKTMVWTLDGDRQSSGRTTNYPARNRRSPNFKTHEV